MFFKLSIKNIIKSIKDYAIYFFTLILGVAIFYVFNSIDSQTAMLNVSKSTSSIIELMINLLAGVSVFISFILGFLIIYANRFLMKRRNKEFGIYLTLGMSKRKISFILFLETLIIGFISLIIGLGLGVILSQFMSILVANMFEADLSKFEFVFSLKACIKCFIYFGIMYLLVMVFNTLNISKCKLIDLLHSSKKSEKIKFKNSILCIILFIISTGSLLFSYYLVTDGLHLLKSANSIFIPIIIGSLSTFFIFYSLSGLLLKIIMSFKNVYYKGLNSFVLRQISSKINTTVFQVTIICLMLFVTICVLSTALSLKNSMTKNLKTLSPVDIVFSKKLDLNENDVNESWQLKSEMIEDSKLTVRETLNNMDYNINKNIKDRIEFTTYNSDSILMKDTLGKSYEELTKVYQYARFDVPEEFIRLSDYNKIAELYGLKKLSLSNNQYILVANYKEMVEIRNRGLKDNTPISINNINYYPKYKEAINGFYYISSNYVNPGFFVVPDNAVEFLDRNENLLIGNYKDQDKTKAEQVIENLSNHPYIKNTSLDISTKISIYESSVGLGATVTFIGLYLGIIFLISSAAILALKELSESTDNKNRYKMIRKLGADEFIINKALFVQIGIFFMIPLVLAIIHSFFGIKFCNQILASIGTEGLLPSILMTAIFIVIIYGGYFLITYFCSRNIIKENRY